MNLVEAHHLKWSFDGGDPYFEYGGWGDTPARAEVDPFPCYAHNASMVRYLLDRIEAICPINNSITTYISHYEFLSRSNGFAQDFDTHGSIVLSGKRQPIISQMTRYIVGHEYGHHIEFALDRKFGHEKTCERYLKLRPKANRDYGARKWHSNIRELFANDFRILVLKQEEEYWPHPGFEHPHWCPDVIKYWAETLQMIKEENL